MALPCRITIKVDIVSYNTITNFCNKTNQNVSMMIRTAIFEHIKNADIDDEELKRIAQEQLQHNNFLVQACRKKIQANYMHQYNNCLTDILQMIAKDFQYGRPINHNAIKLKLKSYEDMFDAMPDYVKKVFKKEHKGIKQLKIKKNIDSIINTEEGHQTMQFNRLVGKMHLQFSKQFIEHRREEFKK